MPAKNKSNGKAKNGGPAGIGWLAHDPVEVEIPDHHDIIVIGASAGGVEALQKVVRGLPSDLPAAIFVVVHTSPQSPGLLPEILNRTGPLPASYPKDGEIIEEGHIYIAPANYHLLVERGIIRVVRGPKENRHRPAIDPLFRSAARYYGPRVIGVILSGMLDDGTFGLLTIKQRGGLTITQEPADALYPEMPAKVIRLVRQLDYTLPATQIGPRLAELVQEKVADQGAEEAPSIFEQIEIENGFAMSNIPNDEVLNKIGRPSTIACPDCHGTLWEINNQGVLRFRCRVGHSYTASSLLEEHSEALESALWAAFRNLEENASINRRLADRAKSDNNLLSASAFIENAVQTEQQADLIKRVLQTNKAIDEQAET